MYNEIESQAKLCHLHLLIMRKQTLSKRTYTAAQMTSSGKNSSYERVTQSDSQVSRSRVMASCSLSTVESPAASSFRDVSQCKLRRQQSYWGKGFFFSPMKD